MQEFLKYTNLNDSGGIPPYFRNSGGNSRKNRRNFDHSDGIPAISLYFDKKINKTFLIIYG
jgi:hypothetical protein